MPLYRTTAISKTKGFMTPKLKLNSKLFIFVTTKVFGKMHKQSYYVVNGITVYRILAAPFLVWLIFTHKTDVFKWLLAISFFTDAIDGYLARRYKATSILGARLDSIADDLTIVAALTGIYVLKQDFVLQQMPVVLSLFALYV